MLKKAYVFVIFLGFNVGLTHGCQITVESKQEALEQDLVIQEMQEQDIDSIKKLFQRNPDIAYSTGISSDFSFYLNNDGYKVYVCKNKTIEEVYGFLLAINQADSFYVRALGVDKDYRRYGIATKLLKSAYGFAQQNNYDKLTICASNEKAQKCYDKFGFKLDFSTGYLTISFFKMATVIN